MGKRGRPTKPRKSELGCYIEEQRRNFGWSVLDLARKAHVPHKVLSKLELDLIPLRRPGILLKIAKALGVHPDQLLVRAHLTPFLRPPIVTDSSPPRKTLTLIVNEDECRQVENYLQFLRYMAKIKSLCNSTDNDSASSSQYLTAKNRHRKLATT